MSTVIPNTVDTGSQAYKTNRFNNVVARVNHDFARRQAEKGGGQEAQDEQRKLEKLPPRERIDVLLDPGTSLYELAPLAGHDEDQKKNLPAGSVVAGIGEIEGHKSVIIATDQTVDAGHLHPVTVKKIRRALQVAKSHNLPVVTLLDTAGLKAGKNDLYIPGENRLTDVFDLAAELKTAGVHQITAVMGPCVGEVSNLIYQADHTVCVGGMGSVYVENVEAAAAALEAGLDIRTLPGFHPLDLGSAVDYQASGERDALDHIRAHVKALPPEGPARIERKDAADPLYDPGEIAGIVGDKFDMYQVIARVVDGSRFNEFKGNRGDDMAGSKTALICGTAHIDGFPVGIVANQSILTSPAAQKGAEFIQMCCRRKIPLVYLQDTTGYMVGSRAEHGGIGKDGATMVMATANAQVPSFTVIVKASIGAGNYGMKGRAYEPDFMFMFPKANISVIGPSLAAGTLASVKEGIFKRAREKDANASFKDLFGIASLKDYVAFVDAKYAREEKPLYAEAHLWHDRTLNPGELRNELAFHLSMACRKEIPEARFGHFRM